MAPLSRRGFIKLSSLAALSLSLRGLPPDEHERSPASPIGLGRVTRALAYYDRPTSASLQLGIYGADTVLNIYAKTTGGAETSPNAAWFRVDDGWVYSSYVQPVRDDLNPPVLDVPAAGCLAEVTVPFTEAWRLVNQQPEVAYRFYYSTTHWVDRAVTDEKGNVWHRVYDDLYREYYFVLAKHLRRVVDEELAPLSAGALDKRIELDLRQQRLTAYADGRGVFNARFSSGRAGWETPVGQFRVERKRPSRHMAAGELASADGFDLPGVPWVAYFTWTGVAFHGTYWHNDFGRPRSRGCINLSPADAKWIYRWTLPVVPPGEAYVRDPNGTQVVVY